MMPTFPDQYVIRMTGWPGRQFVLRRARMSDSGHHTAIVLPPGEGFSPHAVGAIGLLVHRLARRDRRCVVIGAPAEAEPFPDAAFQPVARTLWPGLSRTRRYAAQVARILVKLSPALIEVHNRPEVALRLAMRFPRLPVVLFLHNDPQGMRRARTAAERATLLDRLARVVTVSDWLRRRLVADLPAPPARAPAILPNAIDSTELPEPREREPLILFAGRVVRDKGADAFVAACAGALPRLPGWRAEIIGADRFRPAGPDTTFLRRVRAAAAEAGIGMRGYRPHAEVLDAMSRAAVVVVPSRWPEPFGMTALEAMACGAALVCSARGGLPEVAGDAALYADPDDPAALADAILALAREPARRGALGQAARARARHFDAGAAATALARLRAEVLAA